MSWLTRTEYLSKRLAQLRIGKYRLPSGFARWLARLELGEPGAGVCIQRPISAVSLVDLAIQDLLDRRQKP